MIGRIAAGVGLALLLASCAPLEMGDGTYFGFSITGVTSAPPPPRVVRVHGDDDVVPGTRVYVVRDPGADCDMFRYGSSFFMYYGGYWYRSEDAGDRFVAIDVRRVPKPVLEVPEGRWRHHPHGRARGHDRDDEHAHRDHDEHGGRG